MNLTRQATSLSLKPATAEALRIDSENNTYISVDTALQELTLGKDIRFLGESFDLTARPTSFAIHEDASAALEIVAGAPGLSSSPHVCAAPLRV